MLAVEPDDAMRELIEHSNVLAGTAEAIPLESETLLAMYSTTSSLAVLARDEREALFDRVRPLLGGPYRLPVKHGLTWTRLR